MATLALMDSRSTLLRVLMADALAVPFLVRRTVGAAVRHVRDGERPTMRQPAEGERSER